MFHISASEQNPVPFLLTIEIVRKWTQTHSPNIYCPNVLTNMGSDDIISTARYGTAAYCQKQIERIRTQLKNMNSTSKTIHPEERENNV